VKKARQAPSEAERTGKKSAQVLSQPTQSDTSEDLNHDGSRTPEIADDDSQTSEKVHDDRNTPEEVDDESQTQAALHDEESYSTAEHCEDVFDESNEYYSSDSSNSFASPPEDQASTLARQDAISSRFVPRVRPGDDVSSLGDDTASDGCSVTARESRTSNVTLRNVRGRCSYRVLHPPMPLCSLQNLEKLPWYRPRKSDTHKAHKAGQAHVKKKVTARTARRRSRS